MKAIRRVRLTLVGLDGNAFNLLGKFSSAARLAGWSKSQIEAVIKEATADNYDHLLRTLLAYTEDDHGDGE